MWDAAENRLFLGCLVRLLSTEFDLQSLISHINAVSSTHAKIERLDGNAGELIEKCSFLAVFLSL